LPSTPSDFELHAIAVTFNLKRGVLTRAYKRFVNPQVAVHSPALAEQYKASVVRRLGQEGALIDASLARAQKESHVVHFYEDAGKQWLESLARDTGMRACWTARINEVVGLMVEHRAKSTEGVGIMRSHFSQAFF